MIYKQIPYINTFKRPIRAEGAKIFGGISTIMNPPPPCSGTTDNKGGVHIIAIDDSAVSIFIAGIYIFSEMVFSLLGRSTPNFVRVDS